MKASRIYERLDRMPVLKLLVPFAAGIALAGRYELPLWFLAGAFVCTGVMALLLRSQASAVGMLLTAGFAAAQLRTPSPTVPRDIGTVYEITVEDFPPTGAGMPRPTLRWRHGATPRTGIGTPPTPGSGSTSIRSPTCNPANASAAAVRCGPSGAERRATAA